MTEASARWRQAAHRAWQCLVMGLGLLLATASPGVVRQDPDLTHRRPLPEAQRHSLVSHAEVPYHGPGADALAELWSPGQRSELGVVVDAPDPAEPQAWTPVELPRHQPRDPVRASAPDRGLVVDWLRVDHEVQVPAGTPLALYLPRAVGAAVQVIVHDGVAWRLRWDGADQWREQWNRPILVDLGPAPANTPRMTLAVGLIHYDGGITRVTPIWVGPREELASRAGWRHVLQQVAPQVGSLTYACTGLFALLFWLGRRRELAYLLFWGSSVVWLLRNLHYYVSMPATPAAYDWFWWMSNASLSWVMVLVYLFALRFDHRRSPWLERGLLGFVVLMSLLAMPLEWSPVRTLVQLHLLNGAAALVVLARLSWLAWHGGRREFRVITAGLWLTELFGIHDLLLVAGGVSPLSIYLLPYATLVMLLIFLFAVQTRYTSAIVQVEQANAELERRLAEREAELRSNHERLRGVEREQALLLERQRLMRDMHDGLGSTLMSSLVLVEQGRLAPTEVAVLLRECVDDLRLVIDSLEPIGNDLVTLLASLRHRLGRRLESAGLLIHWQVRDLPPLAWLQPPDALQVLRIVQEVLTNVLKHAHAREIRLATCDLGDRVQVSIEDDGCGFDPQAASAGRGLRHLAQRAARLGGTVSLHSAPGEGTRVVLELPRERGLPA